MFIARVPEFPTIPQILELERIIVIDKTGPNIPVGASPGKACLVGEFLKGSFFPREVVSGGDILSIYVGNPNYLDRISQSGVNPATAAQDGSAQAFDGNGLMELKGKSFRGLVLQRVDCDMQDATTSGNKAFLKLTVTIDANDTDVATTKTNKDIIIPAGLRMADVAIGAPPVGMVALSQDIFIPKGTAITGGSVVISCHADTGIHSCLQDEGSGVMIVNISSTGTPVIDAPGQVGPTAFFVKGTTVASAGLVFVIDSALPSVDPGTLISAVAGVKSDGTASAVFAAVTGAAAPTPDNLMNRIFTRYAEAIDRTLPGSDATNNITDIWSARNWASNESGTPQPPVLRAKLWDNAQKSSSIGRGRKAYVCVAPATATTLAARNVAKSAVGVLQQEFTGVNADRICISFPYAKVFSSEFNKSILVSPNGSRVCMRNNIPEEYQTSVGTPENAPIQALLGVEDAFKTWPLEEGDFVSMKAKGVGVLVKDRPNGWWFYSGVTAVDPAFFATRVPDNRRAFADFVQDTLIAIAATYAKKPGTTERVNGITAEVRVFMDGLLSPNNLALQRIEAYLVDPKSGNQPNLTALGIRVLIVKCRMLGDLNDIIFNTEIGQTVTITQTA